MKLKLKKWWPSIKKLLATLVLITVIGFVGWITDSGIVGGLIAFFLICLMFAVWRITSGWTQFKEVIRFVETAIWGKPILDHTKEEFKRKKVKLVWRKKVKEGDCDESKKDVKQPKRQRNSKKDTQQSKVNKGVLQNK